MKVILADTHLPFFGRPQGSPNLGLLYLASYAREHIEGVEFSYVPNSESFEGHLARVVEERPRVYALSATSFGLESIYGLTRAVKERLPETVIVCGGAHATAEPEDLLRKSSVDICVLNEGEETFREILEKVDGLSESLDTIHGVAFLRDGAFVRTPPRALIEDLDTVPFPARDLVNEDDYPGLPLQRARPNAEMIVTRGCPFRCVFCANPVFEFDAPRYRKRSPESIAEEAEQLYQMGYREIFLHSDELNVDLQWSIDVCRALAALGHRDLFFQVHLRVLPISEEFAYWLAQANFWLVRFGIESGSDRVLKGIKKKMATEHTEAACRLMSRHGIKVFSYFMMFQLWENREGELEHETVEEVEQSLRYAKFLWSQGILHYMAWKIAIPVPGAELYRILKRRGILGEDFDPNQPWDVCRAIPGLTNADVTRVARRGMTLQARMALKSGLLNWRNWKAMANKARCFVRGLAAQ